MRPTNDLEEESPVDGIMLEQFFKEDDNIPTMTNVCVIGEEGESTAEFAPKIEGDDVPAEAPAEAPGVAPAVEAAPAVPTAALPPGEFIKISPRAKALAEKTGIDPHLPLPTGPNGRIIERTCAPPHRKRTYRHLCRRRRVCQAQQAPDSAENSGCRYRRCSRSRCRSTRSCKVRVC